MLTSSTGIVLRVVRHTDAARICEVLTREAGCISFIVRVASSKRGAAMRSALQPLGRIEAEWDHRAGRDLASPRNLRPIPYTTIPFEPSKAAMALFLADFLHFAVRSEPPQQALFDYVWQSLEWFDTSEHGYANFHVAFLLRLSRFLGFCPTIETFQPGAFFDMQNSEFTMSHPAHPYFLPPAEAALLPDLLRMDFATMHLFRMTGRQRSELLRFAIDYYRLHVPGFPELKSLSVLSEVFSTG